MNFDENYIDNLLNELTLEEKVGMIHGSGLFRTKGVERFNIPPVKMSDGPMGVRFEFEDAKLKVIGLSDDYVTYLPSNSALASTWNIELAYKAGYVLGEEARGRGKDIILAPGINIKRVPLCGRNFEYMSEDPFLISELTVPFIKGIQENDVAACVKHFAANAQETERLWVDTIVDERTLMEIYFPAFKAAVCKANSYSLMGAYNKLNGEHCCKNKYLLSEILRKEWGYDGVIVSDWGGVHDTIDTANSELDIEMSIDYDFDEYYMANPLIEKVKFGEVNEDVIDKKVRNILRMMLRLKMIGDDKEKRKSGTYNTPEHREIALETARESIVLLKNNENILPLKKDKLKKLLVIGQNAEKLHSNGGGSAEIKSLYEISPLMGLKTKLGGNVEVIYAKGYYVPEKDISEINWQETSLESKNEDKEKQKEIEIKAKEENKKLFDEAVMLAKDADNIIIFGGLNHDFDIEGTDRKDMSLPYEQDKLINAILDINPNAIIVMFAGSPVDMTSFESRAKAIVWNWYSGIEGGNALAEVLLGITNPSGKLPETFPKKMQDCVAIKSGEFGKKDVVEFKEGIFVGYRYYDKNNIEPLFPFGYGLSYTTFEYSNLNVNITENNEIELTFSIKNAGQVDGAEIAQVYVTDVEASVERPIKELKGFKKVFLNKGEQKEISIKLSNDDFKFYDIKTRSFKFESGEFIIKVGSSSKDIRLEKLIYLK